MLKAVLTLCLSLVLFSVGFAQQNNQEKVVFKANTEFSIQSETAINSETNNIGDDVNFVLTEDITGEGIKLLKGSVVYGRIVNIAKMDGKNDTTKVCVMFDFVKNGDDFIPLVAGIILIDPNPDSIKLSASPKFNGGTTLSLKGKGIQIDKGKIFRIKLIQDMTSNKTA